MKIALRDSVLKMLTLLLGACLLAACAPETPDEGTPAVRQQLDDVQARLDEATKAAEDRLRDACAENPDC